MARLFVPYIGKNPAPIVINGHRLLIVSAQKSVLKEGLPLFGGNRVRTLPEVNSEQEKELQLSQLAERSNAGIVVAPQEMEVDELLKNLENELPWLQ